MLPTKFLIIWPSGFREEFKKSANQKQESPVVTIFVNGSGRNEQTLQRTFHRCFLPSFRSFGQTVSEEKIFLNRPIGNKNCLQWPCLFMDRDDISNLQRTFHRCFLPSFDSFGQAVSEIFQKSTNQKQELPVVAMFVNGSGRNEQFYRGPSIDASYQVSVHFAKRFQRRSLKISQSETGIACGGHVC